MRFYPSPTGGTGRGPQSQCPYSDGPATFKARALHNLIYRTTPGYNDDNCIPEGYSGKPASNFASQEESNTLLEKLKERESKTIRRLKPPAVKIYPNPATNQIWIKGYSEGETIIFSIRDVSGRLLFENEIVASLVFPLQINLTNGIYFVTLIQSNGEKVIRKIIINN